MPDQVIRYDTKTKYLEFKNQRAVLTGGQIMNFPSWESEPDDYWEAHYAYLRQHPDAILMPRTLLIDETVRHGKTVDQRCQFDTIMFKDNYDYTANEDFLRDTIVPDPGVPVSALFKTKSEAEKMRAVLLEGDADYYYDIRHTTHCHCY